MCVCVCVCAAVTSAVTSIDLGHEYDSTRKAEVDDDDSFDWFAPSGSAERLTVLFLIKKDYFSYFDHI